jgi:hypothetical protein
MALGLAVPLSLSGSADEVIEQAGPRVGFGYARFWLQWDLT